MAAIRVDHRPDGVAVLTFDQPGGKANVLTRDLLTELDAALAALAARPGVAGLVLASAKPGIFIAGADLKFFAAAAGPNDPAVRDFIEYGLRVLDRLESFPVPTCAAIDGAALGGGLEVALACDFRVYGANPRAIIGLPEVKLGLIPGLGGTQRLPRVAGLEAAFRMISTGEPLDVRHAASIDMVGMLVPVVVDSSDLINYAAGELVRPDACRAQDIARKRREAKQSPLPEADRLAFRPPIPASPTAVREAMTVLIRGSELPLADALRLETEAFMRVAGSDESKRLIAEFFANRKRG